MKSREFRSRLAEAARLTVTTGHEAGFRIYVLASDPQLLWSPTIEGSTGSIAFVPEGDLAKWADAMDIDLLSCVAPLYVHTHPHIDSLSLDLSDKDLLAVVYGNPDFDVRPIIGVATIGDDRNGALLLMRSLCNLQKPRPELCETLSNRYRAYKGPWPSEALARALMIPHQVASTVIQYSIPRGYGPASLQLKESFRTFCYLGEPRAK